MTSILSYLSRNRKEKIELILMQKLVAMNAGNNGNNQSVIEEAQKRLEKFRPKDVLSILYHIRNIERSYEPAVSKEIEKYESMKK